MGKTATNLSIVLGLVTVVFAGYYLYTQKDTASLGFSNEVPNMENVLNNTKVFIDRRQMLDQVGFNVDFFEDRRFLSLRSFTKPIQERPIGRPDPFADAEVGSGVSNF